MDNVVKKKIESAESNCRPATTNTVKATLVLFTKKLP